MATNPPRAVREDLVVSTLLQRFRLDQRYAGWAFVIVPLVGIVVFVVVPILMAAWLSMRDWNGINPPFQSEFVGLDNYQALLVDPGIVQRDFGLSLRNNLYYVLGVVPLQTTIAFFLAVVLNQKFLKGKGFFRTSFYFPSITSSIAISLIFIFLFQRSGPINAFIELFLPVESINWLANANGLIHNLLATVGVDQAPEALAEGQFLGVSWWEWLAGPSVTLFAIMLLVTWTTTGTMMLLFLAGLQNIPETLQEASRIDGASPAQHFRLITIPMMKPTIVFVLTISIIGTWQVFDQIFAISSGGPQKTTLTPAYLIYREGFQNFGMGRAAAVAFVLFGIILVFTLLQRRLVGDPDLGN